MKPWTANWILVLGVVCPVSSSLSDEPADLVVLGAKVVTLDPRQPHAEAVAARDERIVAVGSNDDMGPLIGPQTQALRLTGQMVIPGFIEGHGHFVGLGQAQMMLDLRTAETWDDIVQQVRQAVSTAQAGEWIIGRGWHQAKWQRAPVPQVDGYPTHTELSAASPQNPVLLTHASGHMSIANAVAMQRAGVRTDTPDPRGGEIVRDASGAAIGVFRETAQGLVRREYSKAQRMRSADQRREDLLRAIQLAGQECLAKGVTSFQDAGSSFNTIRVFRSLADRSELPVRLWVMVRDANDRLARQLADYRMIGRANHRLTVRGIKRSIDGALGPHGAWLLAPYDDLPQSTGFNTSSVESIRETARLALAHGYQLCVHAIGDRANRETLNLFEEVFEKQPNGPSLRWRIEHAQHLHPNDIPRFAHLGVIASMQGVHCTSDAVYVIRRLGQRRAREGAYAWRSLLDSGAVVINGTDAPVEDVNPILSFYASVTRRLPSDVTFFAEQSMTRIEALRSYTVDAAYAAFEEDLKGVLAPGKLADLVVLTHDILNCPEEQILQAKVVYTVVGGKVAYAANRGTADTESWFAPRTKALFAARAD